jgi:dTDP-4-dehydrorhamnose reductase
VRKAKVVVLGAAGMLGHKLFQVLRERLPGTIATMRSEASGGPLAKVDLLGGTDVVSGVDVMEVESLRRRLKQLCPDVIVNAVGIIKQRKEAVRPIPSIAVNSLLPHLLADEAAGWGGRLIHFSTDCVFTGRKGHYSEDDPSDAEDLYGKSKFLGEVASPNAVTLRTSFIGRELTGHRSLLDWFLAHNGRKVRGFRRVVYAGITTNEMAKVVTRLITDFPNLSGLYQVASEPITKYDLLQLIRDAYHLAIEIAPDDEEISDRSMLGDKFRKATGYVAPPWPAMIGELAGDETPYTDWGTSVL